VFFTETHLDNQVLDSDIIIEGFETPSRKDRDKLNEITEYVDLNLVNAVLHKACTYNINQCKMSYKSKDTISLTFLQQAIPIL
jgi:hypothetical protein